MTHSTIKAKPVWMRVGAALFWLLIWQICAEGVGQDYILPTPFAVLTELLGLIRKVDFWLSITSSLLKILIGFILALFLGALLAALSCKWNWIDALLYPLITVIKSIPVASFVILALLWVSSGNLSVFISFLMAFPIVFQNLREGIRSTDHKLLEMADVFQIRFWKRFRYLYFPSMLPFISSAISLSAGLCWKSGIAAEVIGLPKFSIGSALYSAKIFLNTSEMFAWTFVIVGISLLSERAVLRLLKAARNHSGTVEKYD